MAITSFRLTPFVLCLLPFTAGISSAQDIHIAKLHIASTAILLAANTNTSDVGMGQGETAPESLLPEDGSTSGNSSEIFGLEGGYFHPYLSLTGEYTDNLFNVNEDYIFEDGTRNELTSNFLTRISPGIWISIPAVKEVPVTIAPANSAPGGLQFDQEEYAGTDRYNLYLHGGADFKTYSEDSAELPLDDTDYQLEGSFRYNLRSGLSLQALDRYSVGSNRFDAGTLEYNSIQRFDSNLGQLIADWDFSEKFRVKGTAASFFVDYEEDDFSFLDREDISYALYLYYKFSLKTDFFIEYRMVDVAYDENISIDTDQRISIDSNQSFIYGGIDWQSTGKLTFRTKLGFQQKDFEDSDIAEVAENESGFALEGQMEYRISLKTLLELEARYKTEETDINTAIDKQVFAFGLNYNQQFTERLRGRLQFDYENAVYDQISQMNFVDGTYDQTAQQDREDDRFALRPSLQYIFKDWLMLELAYQFDTRDSTDDQYDNDTNTVILSLNGAL